MSTSIFLSYARGDDEAFVRRLYDDLTARGFDVWFDRVSMPSRLLSFHQEILDAINARDRLLLVVGPKAVTSDYVIQEWQFAYFAANKCVNTIVRMDGRDPSGRPVDGYALMPEELKLLHAEDFRDDARYAEHLENLVRQLQEPPPVVGKLVAVPELPPGYRAQPERLKALRDLLLIDLQKPVVVTGAAARVGLQGMGGIGKSVLANALAHHPEVQRAFPGGIYWVSFGQQPRLEELQRRLAKELGGEALFNDTFSGKEELRRLVAEKTVLLILDDVWERSHAEAFNVVGPRSRILLTTRDAGLVTALAAKENHYRVELPTLAEARAILAGAAQVPPDDLPREADEIIAQCGRLPLALALCGGMAQGGTPWASVLAALRDHDLQFLSSEHPGEEQHANAWKAMDVSLRVLTPAEQDRFAELAVFNADTGAPPAAVATLWQHTGGLNLREAEALLAKFTRRALVQRPSGDTSTSAPWMELHDLLRHFASGMATKRFGSLTALHQRLLDAYAKQCPTGWPSGPNDGYFLQNLGQHLAAAGKGDELADLLLDLPWLEKKNEAGLTFDLLGDFQFARDKVRKDYPRRHFIKLIEEALRREIHFIHRHRKDYPQALFQVMWNLCWWYDCQEAKPHYQEPEGGWKTGEDAPPWAQVEAKLFELFENWRLQKERGQPGFYWIHSKRPPPLPLGGSQIAVLHGHADTATSVIFSPDGTKIASGSYDETVRLWNAESGYELAVLVGHEYGVESVCFSPDGCKIASGSGDNTVRVWDASSGQKLAELHGHENWVRSVCFSPDGSKIVSGSDDSTLRVWDAASGQEMAVLRGHEDAVNSVCFSLDGRKIVSGSWDKTVRLWDVATACEFAVFYGHQDRVCSVSFSPDGKKIVSGSYDDTMRIWETSSCLELAVLNVHKAPVSSVGFSPDGCKIVSGSYDKTVRVWDAATVSELTVFKGHEGGVFSVSFSPDGTRIVSGSTDRTVRLWDVATKFELAVQKGHEDPVVSVNFSSEGSKLASISRDDFKGVNAVRLWETATGKELISLKGHEDNAISVSFSPDESKIVIGSLDNTVRIWDVYSGRELAVLRGHEYAVGSVCFSPDGQKIASGGGNKVRLWDAISGCELGILCGHKSGVASVCYSSDGSKIASRTYDNSVRVWDSTTRCELVEFRHKHPVRCMCFSPDGRKIASGSLAHTVLVWDAALGCELAVLKGNDYPVDSVSFSSDGKKIASGSSWDKTVWVWSLESDKCIEVIQGFGDTQAIMSGSEKFPWLALCLIHETVVVNAATKIPIAWFEAALENITTHPSGRIWAGSVANHLYLIELEGGKK